MSTEASPVIVKMKFRSGPLAVRAALAHILSELKPMEWHQEDLGTIEIVLAEALNNIVEHAYTDDEVAGPIAIDCRAQPDTLHFRIIDDGASMPDEEIPEITEVDIEKDLIDLPEGGFGWYLIRKLAEDVSYTREAEQNVLDVTLAIKH